MGPLGKKWVHEEIDGELVPQEDLDLIRASQLYVDWYLAVNKTFPKGVDLEACYVYGKMYDFNNWKKLTRAAQKRLFIKIVYQIKTMGRKKVEESEHIHPDMEDYEHPDVEFPGLIVVHDDDSPLKGSIQPQKPDLVKLPAILEDAMQELIDHSDQGDDILPPDLGDIDDDNQDGPCSKCADDKDSVGILPMSATDQLIWHHAFAPIPREETEEPIPAVVTADVVPVPPAPAPDHTPLWLVATLFPFVAAKCWDLLIYVYGLCFPRSEHKTLPDSESRPMLSGHHLCREGHAVAQWHDYQQHVSVQQVLHARLKTDPLEDRRLVQDRFIKLVDGDIEVGRIRSGPNCCKFFAVIIIAALVLMATIFACMSINISWIKLSPLLMSRNVTVTDLVCSKDLIIGCDHVHLETSDAIQHGLTHMSMRRDFCESVVSDDTSCFNHTYNISGFGLSYDAVNHINLMLPAVTIFLTVLVLLIILYLSWNVLCLGFKRMTIDYVPHALSAILYEMSMNPTLQDLEVNWATRWRRLTSAMNIPDTENLALRNGTFEAARLYVLNSERDFQLSHSRSTLCDQLFAGVS
jgi:hypothetical protein